MVAAALATLSLLSPLQAVSEPVPVVRVTGAWALSTPPGAEVAAAYATLQNTSGNPLVLTGVHSDSARATELHQMDMRDGMMRMRHLDDGLRLAPGARVALEPGGTHLMLFGLRGPLVAGARVSLRFDLSDGSQITVDAPVRDSQT